jgi:thiol-disulfide isomerase/thioredoxin
MRFQRIAVAALVLALGVVCAARAEGLKVGDPAPKLEVKEFLKGEPVASLEKGKIYVIEFWATWCGPCRTSIPHVTELQKKHKDVVFIGVSVWENDANAPKPFVEQMGDKMGYRVALDDGLGNAGKMANNWMKAAEQDGIPAAFIIGKDNKVLWIGHPMQMDKPLEQIVAGTYDLAAGIAEAKKQAQVKAEQRAKQAKLQEIFKKVQEDEKAGNKKEVLQGLLKMDEMTEGRNPNLVHRLAQAYFDAGDAAKALETEERVAKMVKGTPAENNKLITDAIEKYKKAAEKK